MRKDLSGGNHCSMRKDLSGKRQAEFLGIHDGMRIPPALFSCT